MRRFRRPAQYGGCSRMRVRSLQKRPRAVRAVLLLAATPACSRTLLGTPGAHGTQRDMAPSCMRAVRGNHSCAVRHPLNAPYATSPQRSCLYAVRSLLTMPLPPPAVSVAKNLAPYLGVSAASTLTANLFRLTPPGSCFRCPRASSFLRPTHPTSSFPSPVFLYFCAHLVPYSSTWRPFSSYAIPALFILFQLLAATFFFRCRAAGHAHSHSFCCWDGRHFSRPCFDVNALDPSPSPSTFLFVRVCVPLSNPRWLSSSTQILPTFRYSDWCHNFPSFLPSVTPSLLSPAPQLQTLLYPPSFTPLLLPAHDFPPHSMDPIPAMLAALVSSPLAYSGTTSPAYKLQPL
ncbi:hypothetical protein DFH06DRAFT_145267 [Mycena polygramma]|nr:hypothetical protein DFH06DRAFT_145267 [Mycena polygramma]